MKLHYIYHSGFALETDRFTVLIDYYKDTSETDPKHGWVHDRLLPDPKPLYILSTHFHPDHFNREILSWHQEHPDIHYIFSRDILKHRRASVQDAIWLRQGDTYQDDLLKIEAFGSTDVGISFLMETEGKRMFHAGDLNNWHWTDESTPEEIRKAEGDYLAELQLLHQAAPELYLAMFPVDPRMGTDYMRGARQFVEKIRTDIFVPMHFGEDDAGAEAFAPVAAANGCRFLCPTRRGESFDI
ncbi:MAG: MBL fold metallo-hydrolase [Bacteroides sp.]|nr:MBL fold metallo-hydrolase [Bacteroides sp.]